MADTLEPLDEVQKTHMSALRNVAYHNLRTGHLRHRLAIVVGALVTSVPMTIVHAGDVQGQISAGLAAVVALIGTHSWFLSRRHVRLSRRYRTVAEGLVADHSAERATQARIEMSRIEADEPTEMRAVNAIAYNLVQASRGRAVFLHVPRLDRMLAHVLPFSGKVYGTIRS